MTESRRPSSRGPSASEARLTLAGWCAARARLLVLGGLTVVAYVGAIGRGPGLLWFIASLLLAALIVGFASPRWLVSRLSVTRHGPDRAEEGETIIFYVAVDNHASLPRFMVELVDRLPFDASPAGGVTTLGLITYLPGRSRRQFALPVRCEKRGAYQLGPCGLASSFPLGLVEARRAWQDGVCRLTVYPQLFPITHLVLRGAPSQIHRSAYPVSEGAGAVEFAGLREYRRGDSPRHVHWPSSARMNQLMVKQFEPLASTCLHLVLDLAARSNIGAGREATLEYAVRVAGSIARFSCQHDIRTRLSGLGQRPLDVASASGALQFQRIVDQLALVDADGSTPYASVLEDVAQRSVDGETVVVFLSPPATEAAEFAALLAALTQLRAKRVHLLALVFETRSFVDPGVDSDDPPADAMTDVLHELDAHCLRIRRGDDLLRLFNP